MEQVMRREVFFLKAAPYGLLITGASFMALLVLALKLSSVWIGGCAVLLLVASLFMARQVANRLALTQGQ
jgi:hypothetical protein